MIQKHVASWKKTSELAKNGFFSVKENLRTGFKYYCYQMARDASSILTYPAEYVKLMIVSSAQLSTVMTRRMDFT
jgi:hypothetical protein